MNGMPSREEILKALESVIDPELRRSIVELEMVRSIDSADGLVRVTVSLTTPGCLPEGALAQVANVVCIGSGKGGVGKSTVTANLAAALIADGKRVGILDADVWGYSIPRM